MNVLRTKLSRTYSIVLILILSAVSCKGVPQKNQDSIPFEILNEGILSNIPKPTTEVISTNIRLQKVYDEVNKYIAPNAAAPQVDFKTEQVLFVNLGIRANGGYSVSIDKIERSGEEVIVWVTEESPQPGENVITMITHPFILVKIEKQHFPVRFVWRYQ